MQQERVENALLKIIKIGMFITLLTPLIMGPFGINFVEYPKAVFFRSLIEIIFVFYISLVLLDKKYLPKKNALLLTFLLFYAVMFVASIFGINFYRSFFGDMARGEGLILHLHLLVFFIIITGVFLKREEWLNLFKASVFISGLSSFAAILQQLKVNSFYAMDQSRLSGTLSNPNLFANYIVLSIFITIFLLAAERNKNLKIAWLLLIFLNCYTLFFSGTRASFIGLALGAAFILFINFLKLDYKKKRIVIVGISVFCILILFILMNLQQIRDITAGSAAARLFYTDTSGRIDSWQAAIEAIKARPILGWGFESFAFLSDKYFEKSLSGGIYFDRVHNKVLEILLYSGVIGLALYLLIFAVIFYLIFKYAKPWDGYNKRPKIAYTPILTAFFIAYFVQNIFAFDNIGTFILFFLAAGFINNNFFLQKNEGGEPVFKHKNFKAGGLLYTKFAAIIFVFFFAVWIIYEVNLKPTSAAMYFPGSLFYETSDVQRALAGYEKGISMGTIYDTDLRLAFASRLLYLLSIRYPDSVREQIYKDLLEISPFLRQGVAGNEEQINHLYRFLAEISEYGYILHKNSDSLDEMEKILKEAMAFNPNVGAFYHLTGELEILRNNNGEGEGYITKGCVLDKCGDSLLYKKIGHAYLKKGDTAAALKNFEKIIDINYNNKKTTVESAKSSLSNAKYIDYVASLYCAQLNDFKNCRRVYDKGAEIYPEYADIFRQRFKSITSQNNKQY